MPKKKKMTLEAKEQLVKKLQEGKAAKKTEHENDIEAGKAAKKTEAESNITTGQEGVDLLDKESKPTKDKEAWLHDRIKITIHEMEGLANPQFVGVNGHAFWIELGKEVEVPRAVLGVLKNAVIHTKKFTPIPGQSGAYNVTPVSIPRFAVSVGI